MKRNQTKQSRAETRKRNREGYRQQLIEAARRETQTARETIGQRINTI